MNFYIPYIYTFHKVSSFLIVNKLFMLAQWWKFSMSLQNIACNILINSKEITKI